MRIDCQNIDLKGILGYTNIMYINKILLYSDKIYT